VAAPERKEQDAIREVSLRLAATYARSVPRERVDESVQRAYHRFDGSPVRTYVPLLVEHAVRDELRNELVPLNRKYPIRELLTACRNYPGLSNARRITFEYVMLKGVNDTLADAKALVKLLKGIPAKINLIPFNPWPGTNYQCSDWETIEKFADYINNAGYASPIRTPRGRDILAACGQLKSDSERMRKVDRLALEAMMIAGHGEA